MSRSVNRYFVPVMILSMSLIQGCFYMVEEGKGGVAERFPIPKNHWQLSKRLHQCEVTLTSHDLYGKADRYPALYQQTQRLLTESRRLFKAEYYQQAELALEPVEKILKLMQQGLHEKAESRFCNLNGNREVCL